MAEPRFDLRGKRALVVGASGGIGAAIARALAQSGMDLALAGRSMERLSRIRAEADPAGQRSVAIEVDVRDERSVNDAVGTAIDQLGGLDVVVAASGVSPIYKSAERISVEEWDEIFATNTRGAFLVARAAGQHMLERREGSIIFVTSIYERVGGERLAAYAASKGAVSQLVRSLALEWASRGVRGNCNAPGYVRTHLTAGLQSNPELLTLIEMSTPLGRMATPDEIAGAAIYLASDAASYVTGSTLFVDGGWTAR
ncbi:MAG: SDR family oxidoreductase [Candidatus Limnocylindrales bacterium]|nr:SDR family oxidoreductase [Candidatus Limnocylindrales bacterium]